MVFLTVYSWFGVKKKIACLIYSITEQLVILGVFVYIIYTSFKKNNTCVYFVS